MAKNTSFPLYLTEAETERLREIAGELGYFAQRGRMAGEPSVSAMMRDVVNGRLRIEAVGDETGTGLNVTQRILLEIERDPERTAEEIAAVVGCSISSVDKVRGGFMGKQSAEALREMMGDH